MGIAAKIIAGFILIIIGLGLFVNSVSPLFPELGNFWVTNFIVVLTGVIPILLILIGLFIVWLEIDELKAQKELRQEEEKRKKPTNNDKKDKTASKKPKIVQ
ncbi:MAG: hypothetical protein ABIJ92_04745 [Candidatus Aenigmatarchaeota archaeon]